MKFKLFGIIWDLKPVITVFIFIGFVFVFCAVLICISNLMIGWTFFWSGMGCILSYTAETLEL